jgi:hypothetical protein
MSTNTFVYHPGTGTYMSMHECVTVNVPEDIEDVELYLSLYLSDHGGQDD